MIDYEKLMAYDIPEVRQSYGPRECAFYALSIGVGQDPMDRGDLRFVGAGPLTPFPTMPLVLGHPGFWLANPDTGVDALRLVHGEQGITLYGPLPPEGVVIGKTRVTGIIDKGAGAARCFIAKRNCATRRMAGSTRRPVPPPSCAGTEVSGAGRSGEADPCAA